MVGTLRAASTKKQNNNRDTIMKKTYIVPSVEVIKVDVANVMATSMAINEATVDTSDLGQQLSRELENSMKAWEQTSW